MTFFVSQGMVWEKKGNQPFNYMESFSNKFQGGSDVGTYLANFKAKLNTSICSALTDHRSPSIPAHLPGNDQ
jgi:hypothetical protein